MLHFKTAKQVLDYGTDQEAETIYRKTAAVRAIQVDQPFEVTTKVEGEVESIIKGNAGDYVCIGALSEIWCIQRDIFRQTYVPLTMVSYPVKKGVYVQKAYVEHESPTDDSKVIKVEFGYEDIGGEWVNPGSPHTVIDTPGSVVVVIYNTVQHTVELVNHYRIAAYAWSVELPSKVLTGDPLSTALQLTEDWGYKGEPKTEHIGTFNVSPGRTTEKVHIYYVEVNDSMRNGKPKTEGKPMSLQLFAIEEMVKYGGMVDLKTAYGLNWLVKEYR